MTCEVRASKHFDKGFHLAKTGLGMAPSKEEAAAEEAAALQLFLSLGLDDTTAK
jgi:hypothetical protein